MIALPVFAIYAAENGYDTMGSEHLERIGDVKMISSSLQRREFSQMHRTKASPCPQGEVAKIFDF